MAERNGNKVSTKDFYEELLRQNEARAKMELRLMEAISASTDRLEARIAKQVDDQAREIECVNAGLDELRMSDRKITYLSALMAAAFATAAALVDWARH